MFHHVAMSRQAMRPQGAQDADRGTTMVMTDGHGCGCPRIFLRFADCNCRGAGPVQVGSTWLRLSGNSLKTPGACWSLSRTLTALELLPCRDPLPLIMSCTDSTRRPCRSAIPCPSRRRHGPHRHPVDPPPPSPCRSGAARRSWPRKFSSTAVTRRPADPWPPIELN